MIKDDLFESLGLNSGSCMYGFLHMMRAYSRFAYDGVKNRSDINMQRVGMIMILRAEGNGMSQSQLAEALCVKPSSVASMLKNMEKDDLIVRKADSEDKRINRIYFTEKGKKISDEAANYIFGTGNDFFFNFTDE